MTMHSETAFQQLYNVKDRIDFFQSLSKTELSSLVYQVRFQRYARHETIFHEGEKSNKEMFYLIEGTVDIVCKNKILTSLSKQTLFGEMRMLTGEPRSAGAQAGINGAVAISFWIKEKNQEAYPQAFATFFKNVSRHLAKKLVVMNQLVV